MQFIAKSALIYKQTIRKRLVSTYFSLSQCLLLDILVDIPVSGQSFAALLVAAHRADDARITSCKRIAAASSSLGKRLQQITAHDTKIYMSDTQIISNFTLARWHQFGLTEQASIFYHLGNQQFTIFPVAR